MKFPELLQVLKKLGLTVQLNSDAHLQVHGPAQMLTEHLKKSLVENRESFLRMLQHVPAVDDIRDHGPQPANDLADVEYRFWNGEQMLGRLIGLDTETALIKDNQVPQLALVSVADQKDRCIIHPARFGRFLQQHPDRHYVCHNASFDFHVLKQYLDGEALQIWLQVADTGRLHCTMLLDALLRLAYSDEYPTGRDLGTVAKYRADLAIDKDDPFRLRYSELIGTDWSQADPGFFQYAIKDAVAAYEVWRQMGPAVQELQHRYRIPQHLTGSYGPLTESLQVRAAIVLADIERNGLAVDQSQIDATKKRLDDRREDLLFQLQQLPEAAGLFKHSKKTGQQQFTATGKPCVNTTRLIEVLDGLADKHSIDPPITEKTKKTSTSVKFWQQCADLDPFLSLWIGLEQTSKLCQFFSKLDGQDRIRPRYQTLVRTGRTSCHGPNIQQLPRKGGFREMIIASPGHYLLMIDYSAIELRTLAAVCLQRFGQSRLAEVISAGTDPHAYTAAMFAGKSLEELQQQPDFDQLRQQAKALNFGIPGGLGAASLVTYAKTTYDVDLTMEAAQQFRQRLIEDVYPELALYLGDDELATLAAALHVPPDVIRNSFTQGWQVQAVKKVVRGKTTKADGTQYQPAFIEGVWTWLRNTNQNPDLTDLLHERDTEKDRLFRRLFYSRVVIPTGRIRGRVGFSQARNSPFQGLAADGAKLALWNLYKAGYRIVAFIHDEVLIELPIASDLTAAAQDVERIMCESMQHVTGTVPIACEYAVADRWYKDAKAVFRNEKLRPWYPPKKPLPGVNAVRQQRVREYEAEHCPPDYVPF